MPDSRFHNFGSDLMGRTIYTQTREVNASATTPINLISTAAGQYILKVEIKGVVFVKRLILEK